MLQIYCYSYRNIIIYPSRHINHITREYDVDFTEALSFTSLKPVSNFISFIFILTAFLRLSDISSQLCLIRISIIDFIITF